MRAVKCKVCAFSFVNRYHLIILFDWERKNDDDKHDIMQIMVKKSGKKRKPNLKYFLVSY